VENLRPFLVGVCVAGSLGALASAEVTAGGISDTEFARVHKELTTAKEPWQTLPWHLSLLEARSQAAKEQKPIYMLCRAGHPLGCV
jgi:hypothetical protein